MNINDIDVSAKSFNTVMVVMMPLLQYFNVPVVYSENAAENLDDSDDEDSIYVVNDFEGETFQQLCDCYCRIVAPPVIIRAATQGEVSYCMLS